MTQQDNRAQNENCLEGMRCPLCGQQDGFNFAVTAWAEVTNDGTENFTEVDWEDDAIATCRNAACGWKGKVGDLRVKEFRVESEWTMPGVHFITAQSAEEARREVVNGPLPHEQGYASDSFKVTKVNAFPPEEVTP